MYVFRFIKHDIGTQMPGKSAQTSIVMGTPPILSQGYISATNSRLHPLHDNAEQLKSSIKGKSQCLLDLPPWSRQHEMMF
jgi:hypothetical protein